MNKNKIILFDLDGTLIDSTDAISDFISSSLPLKSKFNSLNE